MTCIVSTYAYLTKYFRGSKAAVTRSPVQIGTMVRQNRTVTMDGSITYKLREPAPIGSYGKQYHVRGRLETNAPLLEHVLFEIEQQNLRYV